MHVIGRVPGCRDDAGLVACAQRAGLAPFPLSLCSAGQPIDSGLLLSFSNIRAERAEREVRRLHEAIADHLSNRLRGRRRTPQGQKTQK